MLGEGGSEGGTEFALRWQGERVFRVQIGEQLGVPFWPEERGRTTRRALCVDLRRPTQGPNSEGPGFDAGNGEVSE
jgi:hypothetical protein